MSIESILDSISKFNTKYALLTGGEPLLQRNTPLLIEKLLEKKYEVSIETHGEHPIENVAKTARIIMDIKTPSSGMSRGKFRDNLIHLKQTDEVKFVIASKEDYFWARNILKTEKIICNEILFSAAQAVKNPLRPYEGVENEWLAEQILADGLNVRFQTQLHKIIWGADRKGV